MCTLYVITDNCLGLPCVSITQGLTTVDEDGFIMAELHEKTGYIPSNLVEEITDQEELSQIREQGLGGETTSPHHHRGREMNGNKQGYSDVDGVDGDSPHKMKAVFDYDPVQDSPNDNSEVELAISEGDVVTVFGRPDPDGFYKVMRRECLFACLRPT